jgi:hypothetical protein
MTFLHRNPDHHSFGFMALPRRGLQHAAFDLPSWAELSDLLVHKGDAGIMRLDGLGRNGLGHILFTYFEHVEKNRSNGIPRFSNSIRLCSCPEDGTPNLR